MTPSFVFLASTLIIGWLSPAFGDAEDFQQIHVFDPGAEDHKFYVSWNSDQWISWLRKSFSKEEQDKRNGTGISNKHTSMYKKLVHLVIIATNEELVSAFSANSTQAYNNSHTVSENTGYFWSDDSFEVYVILRFKNSSRFNVYCCKDKKMYINAKITTGNDTNGVKEVEHFRTFFPKKVKNPKETLRIPLKICRKVSQVRSLVDEITFLIKTGRKARNNDSSTEIPSLLSAPTSESDMEFTDQPINVSGETSTQEFAGYQDELHNTEESLPPTEQSIDILSSETPHETSEMPVDMSEKSEETSSMEKEVDNEIPIEIDASSPPTAIEDPKF